MSKFFNLKGFTTTFLVLSVLYSCNKDYDTVGQNIIESNALTNSQLEAPVFARNIGLSAFRSNGLPLLQLGTNVDPIYGNTSSRIIAQPTIVSGMSSFGAKTHAQEQLDSVRDEKETIKEVFLEIPFFTNRQDTDGDGVIDIFDADPKDQLSDSDGDGLSDIAETRAGTNPLNKDTDGDGVNDNEDTETVNPDPEAKKYDIDSLFGAREASFKIKVQELTYYLRSLDATNNLETNQIYYSNSNIEQGFLGDLLYDDTYTLNTNEWVFFKEDDPSTTDKDESKEVKERLTPRIRISLNKAFFQTKFLDKEGSSELSDTNTFKDYFRGVVISTSDFSEPLLMLLNFSGAVIKMTYEYEKTTDTKKTQDTSDDVFETDEKTVSFNLGTGVNFNIFENEPHAAQVQTALANNNNASRLYLKGGVGVLAELELFKATDGSSMLDEVKSKSMMINEANLVFYIDRETIDANGYKNEPARIFIYDIENFTPLADYTLDPTNDNNTLLTKINHDGIIRLEDDKGAYYKIRITEHVKNIVRKDSTNKKLGLAVTSDIKLPYFLPLESNTTVSKAPLGALINPLGTVLIGPNPEVEKNDKRLKLEIFYTELK